MRIPALVCALVSLALAAQRPLQVADLFKVKRVADPQVSAKGDVAYQISVPDPVTNRTNTRIWLKRSGEDPKELDLGQASRPRFSPDGGRLAYASGGQVWLVDLASGEKRQVTRLSGGATGHVWSPDGATLAFTSVTVQSGVEAENVAHLKALAETKATGRSIKTLMYRHMNAYQVPNQFSHLFVVQVEGTGAPRDLTAGLAQDVPVFSTGAGDDYDFSPDSKMLAFGSHPEAAKATSTNGEVYEVAVTGGPVKKLSQNPAMDCTPRYSPDGRFLAWRAQRRPGYESDRWELWLMDRATGKVVQTTRTFDGEVGAYAWQGGSILFQAAAKAQQPLFCWEPGQTPLRLTQRLQVEAFAAYPGGKKVLAQISSTSQPVELFEIDLGSGEATRFTRHNLALAEELKLNRAEDLWTTGARGKDGRAPQVHALVVKPVGFDPAKKYPVALVIHGGPHGANADQWHYRWNVQAFAGRGFIVVAPNPRGSTGFGQQFSDEIRGDWSGRVITDIMASLDAALKKYPNADRTKVIAAGGSYGGYAVNWIAGHYPDRFAAFVSHAGIFNTLAMQLATEEMWFPQWEFMGFPWESRATKALWERHSPHNAYANFKKPMLVSHGEMDYRVVHTEALQLFNIHQLRGIPSELLLFPDESHTILKPANARQWYETVLAWCERWGFADAPKGASAK
jgi:dipeptidyl aminopeptidase/acylaminoacyl peptidase